MKSDDVGREPRGEEAAPEGVLPLHRVLAEEYRALHGEPPPDFEPGEGEDARLTKMYEAIHARAPAALCLSGGGIRSATFCLGVLQGLARCGLLGKFHYLSTVSGGGYIGSWLTAWMHRDGAPKVIEALRANPTSKTKPEPDQIVHLRSYSNYLSPRIGILSADTWTLVAIYLRNLFLNWLVFLPLLMAALALPRMYVWVIRQEPGRDAAWLLLACGLVLGASALAYIGSHRPSLRKDWGKAGAQYGGLKRFGRWCMLPLVSGALLLTVGRAWHLNSENPWEARKFVYFGAGLHILGWLLTFVYVLVFFKWRAFTNYLLRWRRLAELLVVAVTGALGGAFLWLLSIPAKSAGVFQNRPAAEPEMYAVFDGPLLMLVFLLMGILYVGIGSRAMDDEDREWWARAGAWVLIVIVTWALVNGLVIWGPRLLSAGRVLAEGTVLNVRLLGVLGLVSGVVTILFGLSSRTPANERQAERSKWLTAAMDCGVKLAAPVFALFLVVVLSVLTDAVLLLVKYVPQIIDRHPNDWPAVWEVLHYNFCHDLGPTLWHVHRDLLLGEPLLPTLLVFCALVGVSLLMAFCININQFSLHSMYRNRLIRAYLGASNTSRNKDAFTGFDPRDDLRMSGLWPAGKDKDAAKDAGKPLHVLNMTWNMVRGKNLAWQNRKAASFTVSPLHSGNYQRGYRPSKQYGGEPDSISLGTALTISGAAASPNMGYYSSPAVTFLMTLFNARLGWWLGHPRRDAYRKAGPRLALWPMLQEAFGRTEDDKDFIYLSDGGHFENLGLYEMVLRRCHHIFIVDASRDPAYQFDNLGNAIRIIRVDLGVPIEIRDISIYPRSQNKPGTYCAVGEILYTKAGEAADGVLVYIKPTITRREPTDVFNYAQAHMDFPHESTSDQWFSEQQFESYRMLGLHAVEQVFREGWGQGKGFADLKAQVESYVSGSRGEGGPAPAPPAPPAAGRSTAPERRVQVRDEDADDPPVR